MGKYVYITDVEALKAVIPVLGEARVVAVDLEADSMFHYQEKVCLIQMAVKDHHWVIDPLQVGDLTPLLPVFSDGSIEKIFHGADYDIRSLYRDFGVELNNLFDTELASRYLGETQTGLASMLADRLKVAVDKKFQKKDWSKRPLPLEMLDYAMNDVYHLTKLADILKAELKAVGRYEWVKEECRLLTGVRPPNTEKQPLFLRFPGAGRLDRRSLAVLEALLLTRDQIARKKDRPAFKVMSNRAIMQMALKKPTQSAGLKRSGGLSERQVTMFAKEVLAAIKSALRLSPEALPIYPRNKKTPPEPNLAPRVKALKSWREAAAGALKIPAGVLISNAQITAIAALNPKDRSELATIDQIRRWQVEALGDQMLTALADNASRLH